MKRFLRLPSPAMTVALLALFTALAGTSYAAVTITGKNVKGLVADRVRRQEQLADRIGHQIQLDRGQRHQERGARGA